MGCVVSPAYGKGNVHENHEKPFYKKHVKALITEVFHLRKISCSLSDVKVLGRIFRDDVNAFETHTRGLFVATESRCGDLQTLSPNIPQVLRAAATDSKDWKKKVGKMQCLHI